MTSDSEIPLTGKGSKIGAKMLRFVDEYMLDLNASQAVVRAGYKTRNKDKMATQLMQHPLVRREIAERTAQRREKMDLSAEYVINKLINIVESTDEGNPQAALRGLELLGKHLGLFKERQEISGPDGGAIEMEQKEIKQSVSDFTSKLARLTKRGEDDNVVPLRKEGGS
jgi:phage terminase small subunit